LPRSANQARNSSFQAPNQELLVAEHGRGVGRARLSGRGVGARIQQGADDLRLFLDTAPASGVWPRSLARPGSAPRWSTAATVSAWPW
jgi:hypothetical protein